MLFCNILYLFSYFDTHPEISPCCKRRVNVYEVNFACKLLKQRRHHELIVAPDELVLPSLFKGRPCVTLPDVKKRPLPWRLMPYARLVNDLHNLEGVRPWVFNRAKLAVIVIFPLPDKFCFLDVNFGHITSV